MRLSAFILFLVLALRLQGQNFEIPFQNLQVKDGLPANEVYCSFIDPNGYLWLGTDRGISVFDGTDFQNFTKNDGMLGNTAIYMEYDSIRNTLWIFPYNYRVFGFNFSSNRFVPYPNIDKLLDKLEKRLKGLAFPNTFHIDKDFNLHIGFKHSPSCIFTPDGELQLHSSSNHAYRFVLDIQSDSSCILSGQGRDQGVFESIKIVENDTTIFYHAFNEESAELRLRYTSRYLHSKKHGLVFSIDSTVFIWKGEELIQYELPSHLTFITELNGKVVAGLNHHPLYEFDGGKWGEMRQLSSINSVSSIQEYHGGYILTTLNSGIYIFRNLESIITTFQEDVNQISCIESIENEIYLGFMSGQLSRLKNGEFVKVLKHQHYLSGIIYDSCRNEILLSATTPSGIAFLEPKGGASKKPVKLVSGIYLYFEGCERYSILSHNVFRIDSNNTLSTPMYPSNYKNIKSFVIHQGDTIAGTLNGLYINKLNNEKVEPKEFEFNRVVSLKSIDDRLFVYSQNGKISILKKVENKYKTVENFTIDALINDVHFNQQTHWIGTNKGLYEINLLGEELSFKQYNTSNSIAVSDIDIVYESNDTLYLVEENVLNIVPVASLYSLNSVTPVISSIQVNNTIVDSIRTLPNTKNDIRFEFNAPELFAQNSIAFRYKLKPFDNEWIETKNKDVVFLNLPPNDYTFQLQSSLSENEWSDSEYATFSIAAPWYNSWWFYIMAFGVVTSVILLVVQSRIDRIRTKEGYETQLAHFKHEALSAQMNPHFIFNALNSIQAYILERDTKAANHYMTQFSRLIRLTFEATRKHFIPLSNELKINKLYVSLENLRLDNKINYITELDESIDGRTVQVPALITQPIIENAILHGLAPINGGTLWLNISKENNLLKIQIKDDGIGINNASRKKNEAIKKTSQGVKLTTERLANWNQSTPNITNLKTEALGKEQESSGTCVTLVLQIKHTPLSDGNS